MVTSALSFNLQYPHYVPGLWDKRHRFTKPAVPLWLFAPGFFTDFLRLLLAHEMKMAASPFAQTDKARQANPPVKKKSKVTSRAKPKLTDRERRLLNHIVAGAILDRQTNRLIVGNRTIRVRRKAIEGLIAKERIAWKGVAWTAV